MKRLLVSLLFAFIAVDSTFAESEITAEALMDSLYADRSKVNAVSYYDVLSAGQYDLYFSIASGASASYKTWNAARVQKDLGPLLDEVACRSTRKAKPGDDMDWTEYRRAGGTVVVHLAHLSDTRFKVEAQLLPKPAGCS